MRSDAERLVATSFDVAEIPVPLNFQELQRTDSERARRWHSAVRETAQVLVESGMYVISGFSCKGSGDYGRYIVARRTK